MTRRKRYAFGRNQLDARAIAALVILVAVIVGGILYLRSRKPAPEPKPPGGAFPDLKEKPQPLVGTFKGCPGTGDGGDPELNRLKNRIDEAQNYYPIPFDSVLQLEWPKSIERKDRDAWSSADTAAVKRYEGIPISVEGYLAGTKQEGKESCNCHGIDPEFVDYHVWLVKSPDDAKSSSIVVEVTPRVRANHPAWTTKALGQLNRTNQRVRISGWLMLDPEHPNEVGKSRGTIWEIHPVTQIEVYQNGNWIKLDDLSGRD
ncbi:MAG TPA: hypothetical protein VNN73_18675 [Blastocatellia bacterium]|nr:hypothetical protein [Blastocatellia bacterium]